MKREIIEQRLKLYLDAEQKILLSGQSYTIGARTLTRADLGEVRKIIDDLSAELALLDSVKGGRRKRVVFIT